MHSAVLRRMIRGPLAQEISNELLHHLCADEHDHVFHFELIGIMRDTGDDLALFCCQGRLAKVSESLIKFVELNVPISIQVDKIEETPQ